MSYSTEFPTFRSLPPLVAAMLAKGELADLSWHNDACPSFVRACDAATVNTEGSAERVPVLYVDYADPAERENPEQARFVVTGPSFAVEQACLETDSEADAIARLLSYPPSSPE